VQELALALWLILKGSHVISTPNDSVGEDQHHPVAGRP
jgi:hypothetical protein